MRKTTTAIVTALTLAASTAMAAQQVVTGPLLAPDGGGLACRVANASAQAVTVTIAINDFEGFPVASSPPREIPPGGSRSLGTSHVGRHCAVTMVQGRAKAIRVTLTAHDTGGKPLMAVSGQ